MLFSWAPDREPPQIEAHSKAKLDVLRRYLRAYFDRLNVVPARDQFKLDLVDGFAGGGTFRDGSAEVPGTPLIMLEETADARKRLNEDRKKPLHFDCKFYFVDVSRNHTDHLAKVLSDRGYDTRASDIVIRNGRFADEVDAIVAEIKRRQPVAGRAIFLLDQTGFSQVELGLIRRILDGLPSAEVILTFSADALINFLDERPEIVKAVAPLEVTLSQIRTLLQYRDGDGGRALVQRTLRRHIREATGATFDTPFFIRPAASRRALWLIHLSRHPTARDVMMQCHWQIKNTFEHYGPGDFGMLGWDVVREPTTLPLFNFAELDAEHMKDGLLNAMVRELSELASVAPASIEDVRNALANRTAARFADLDEVILQLAREKEFDILSQDGKTRLRNLKHLQATDRVSFPKTPLLPLLSRRWRR